MNLAPESSTANASNLTQFKLLNQVKNHSQTLEIFLYFTFWISIAEYMFKNEM